MALCVCLLSLKMPKESAGFFIGLRQRVPLGFGRASCPKPVGTLRRRFFAL